MIANHKNLGQFANEWDSFSGLVNQGRIETMNFGFDRKL